MIEIVLIVIGIVYLYIMPMIGNFKAYVYLNGKLELANLIVIFVPLVNAFLSIAMYVNPQEWTTDQRYHDNGSSWGTAEESFPEGFIEVYEETIEKYVVAINLFKWLDRTLIPYINKKIKNGQSIKK